MDENEARKILDKAVEDRGLYDAAWYLNWNMGRPDATLDGRFTADELEAIAWWMRNFNQRR
jgi:hypothetical protein